MDIVIFGKAPHSEHEQLLVSEHAKIRSEAEAKRIVAKLESEHGCTDCRVFIWGGEAPNFARTIN